ncbi:MAG: hypothetical protein AAF250_02125 [Pseudomonadota bacterium]
MTRISATLAAISLLALAACGDQVDEAPSNSAEDFAARINGGEANGAQGAANPTPAAPFPVSVSGPGTHTDPDAACGAARLASYVGREADKATRDEIMEIVPDPSQVRFVLPRGIAGVPDPANPRLNVTLGDGDIIRDARCG